MQCSIAIARETQCMNIKKKKKKIARFFKNINISDCHWNHTSQMLPRELKILPVCVCVLRDLGVVAFPSNYLSSSLNRLKANFSPLESAGEPCM